MKRWLNFSVMAVGLLAVFVVGRQRATAAAPAADSGNGANPGAQTVSQNDVPQVTAAANISPFVVGVVKLSEGGVDAAVIQAHVEASRISVPPTADEIIYLHAHRVPASVITAMINHGAKMSERAALAAVQAVQRQPPAPQPQAAAPAPPVQVVTVVQPTPTYVTSPTYVYPSYSSCVYSYPSYSYYCGWPRYGYCYPGSFNFSFGFGYRGGHFGHYYRGFCR